MAEKPYKTPDLLGTPEWDKCLVNMDKIKPDDIFIPKDLDLSDAPSIDSAEWDHIYDISEDEEKAITAAAVCPPATQDLVVNLENRENAIQSAGYGPLNPNEPNEEFWQAKADRWSVSTEEAKKSLCANCVFFIRTPSMLDCIASGIEQGGSSEKNAWDAIDTAELGYCEALDFKCAASRTCNAWVVGGPITEEEEVK